MTAAIGFWQTVGLHLRTARRRAKGRGQRRLALLQQRKGHSSVDWGWFGSFFALMVFASIHGGIGFVVAMLWSRGGGAVGAAAHSPDNAMASLLLLLWSAMLVLQGEGVDLDLQRRRFPMWEWLISHPVRPTALFLAEMLSPLAANPLLLTAPIFPATLYGAHFGTSIGWAALLLVGLPITLSASCLGKALEIGIMLRFAPRLRAGLFGLIGCLGYLAMFGLIGLSVTALDRTKQLGAYLPPVPWPWMGWLLGHRSSGFSSLGQGLTTVWLVALATILVAMLFSAWGAASGMGGHSEQSRPADSAPKIPARFGRDPLYRKEILWFRRDPGAIVQAVLIPIVLASFQLFNFRDLLKHSGDAWNYLCGAAILFGTYFLWVLGPRSLASEGSALWITLTWPRGLEDLLKAKARMWTMITSLLVGAILICDAARFPAASWKIALVFLGWFAFGRSMAEKAVTLVEIASESGEVEKPSVGLRWAAQLGMLTFSVGIVSQNWPVALNGIVFSTMTAAAMWQNFRARLPYLYDPWSQRLPQAPSLMHAMIAISALIDLNAVIAGMVIGAGGESALFSSLPIIYGVCGSVVCGFVWSFLDDRGVGIGDIMRWSQQRLAVTTLLRWSVLACLSGLVLGGAALGYLMVARLWPSVAETLERSRQLGESHPDLFWSQLVIAVGLAPLAEEYLFRGLLFRALDREWGGWRALVGSAAFFAIYHPPLAWLPVGLVGLINCLLFRRSGHLLPAILLHMSYNLTVTLLPRL